MKQEALRSAFCRYKESLQLLGCDVSYGHVCCLAKPKKVSLDITSSWVRSDLSSVEEFYDFVDERKDPVLFIIAGFNVSEIRGLISYLKNKLCRVHCFLMSFNEDLPEEEILKVQSSYREISMYGSFVSFNKKTIIIYPHA